MAQVETTTHLHRFFPVLGQEEFLVAGETVADVIRALDERVPGIAFYLCDERGRLRRHVNIFVGDAMVSDRNTLSDPVGHSERLLIMQALSGG